MVRPLSERLHHVRQTSRTCGEVIGDWRHRAKHRNDRWECAFFVLVSLSALESSAVPASPGMHLTLLPQMFLAFVVSWWFRSRIRLDLRSTFWACVIVISERSASYLSHPRSKRLTFTSTTNRPDLSAPTPVSGFLLTIVTIPLTSSGKGVISKRFLAQPIDR